MSDNEAFSEKTNNRANHTPNSDESLPYPDIYGEDLWAEWAKDYKHPVVGDSASTSFLYGMLSVIVYFCLGGFLYRNRQ